MNAVANTFELMARAGVETKHKYTDWNIGNIMTVNDSDNPGVLLVDYASVEESNETVYQRINPARKSFLQSLQNLAVAGCSERWLYALHRVKQECHQWWPNLHLERQEG